MSSIENINWTQIGKGAVWGDAPEELMERWLDLGRNQELSNEVSPKDAVARAIKRASAVRKYLAMPEGKQIKSARQWETMWNAKTMRDLLIGAFKKLECVVTVAEHRGMSDYELSARFPMGERVIVIEKWVAEERAQRLKDTGLLLNFGVEEGVLLLMAEDLYMVATEQMGHQPASWIDETGRYFFTRQIFGWPFNPMVGEVVG